MTAMAMGPANLLEASTSDAELVSASRGGDREAFGRIVRRYQGMITGLLYANCGDLHRSEDLAQETFIAAWKSLSGLREPAKLPGWLCQVARHRLLDNARSETRRDARMARAFQDHTEATAPSPEEHALSEEELDLLWKTLREIPQPYRETMVLYYRQGKDAGEVALATDTTEANVRQRLARGREMLREQVAAMLERNLVRSAPGPAFSLAVIAALPSLVPHTAAAATSTLGASALAKGAAATGAKGSAGLLALIAMWIGPLFGFFGGAYGTWVSIQNSTKGRERKFVVRMAVQIWVLVFTSMGILFGLLWAHQHFHWGPHALMAIHSGFWLGYAGLLVALVITRNRRHRQIRREEGLPEQFSVPNSGKQFAFGLAFGTVGALVWMIALAAQAHDTFGATTVAIVTTLLTVTAFAYVRGRTAFEARRFIFGHIALLGIFTLVMVNWRLHRWIAEMNGLPIENVRLKLPLWWMNAFVMLIFGVVFVTSAVSLGRRHETSSPR